MQKTMMKRRKRTTTIDHAWRWCTHIEQSATAAKRRTAIAPCAAWRMHGALGGCSHRRVLTCMHAEQPRHARRQQNVVDLKQCQRERHQNHQRVEQLRGRRQVVQRAAG